MEGLTGKGLNTLMRAEATRDRTKNKPIYETDWLYTIQDRSGGYWYTDSPEDARQAEEFYSLPVIDNAASKAAGHIVTI